MRASLEDARGVARRGRPRRRGASARRRALAGAGLLALLGSCTSGAPSPERLATMCLDASDDYRARHVASIATGTEVTVHDDVVEIRLTVPVGISLLGRPKFEHDTFRCRREGDSIRLVETIYGK